MKTILIITSCYLPGYKAGGPIQSISNIVDSLGDKYNFKIITRDRDYGDESPYPEIIVDGWNKVGKADVFYASRKTLGGFDYFKLLKNTHFDILYVNSFFSPVFSLKPIICTYIITKNKKKIIIAPRGEFAPGALAIKKLRKKLYLSFFRFIKLYKGVLFHALTASEQNEIFNMMGNRSLISVARNIHKDWGDTIKQSDKTSGELKVVYLSRITPKKNLIFALNVFNSITEGSIVFNIYGPIEDLKYWNDCEKIIRGLPNNIIVEYHGAINNDCVKKVFMNHDLFIFPTTGEGDSRIIIESLSSGCPILLSDETFWSGMDCFDAGAIIPLSEPSKYVDMVKKFLYMDTENIKKYNNNAIETIRSYFSSSDAIKDMDNLFIFRIIS